MKSTLIVKNFGPIKEVELDLRNVNVFIGPQSTGKSALAKLYTIFKAPRKFFYKVGTDSKEFAIDNVKALKDFEDVLRDYNIHSFLKADTEIRFISELHTFIYKDKIINYIPKLLNKIYLLESLAVDFIENKQVLIENFKILGTKFVLFNSHANKILLTEPLSTYNSTEPFNNLNESNYKEVFELIKYYEAELSTNTALYIPAERNFITIIKKFSLNLIINRVPIPQHILSFGAELERLEGVEIDLRFIQRGMIYKIVNGEDRVFLNNNESIMLTEAASGIQSVVPMLAPILNRIDIRHRSFVIEEPELNLFPTAQYQLIQLIESNRNDSNLEDVGTIHTYTTHSPYILSALNNLLYAYKVKSIITSGSRALFENNLYLRNDSLIKEIVKADINPDSFTAYQIKDGYAQSIFNRETGLIEENYIDDASDKINEDFEALMELTK